MAEKDYTVIDYPSKIYRIPDTYKCIDNNQTFCLIINIDIRQKSNSNNSQLPFLDSEKITRKDLIF